LHPTGRCPRCGYVLTYDGYRYFCSFCGYPRTRRTLSNAFQDIERNLKARIRNLLEVLKPYTQRQITYYPVNIRLQQRCANCGIGFPGGMLSCPNCGTPRVVIPPTTPAPRTALEPQDLDRRVFDYIISQGGTISISQAAQDLSITQDMLRSSIERLKADGFLNQP